MQPENSDEASSTPARTSQPVRTLDGNDLGLSTVEPDVEDGASDETSVQSSNLIGIDTQVYRRIETLLKTKTHLMFYGPPGTGKTTLAEHVAKEISQGSVEPRVVTASSDWSSQDVIGGYQPVADGEVDFRPGILLENFDRPVVIDEFNRADIDKAFGPLFTVLSGHPVTLPYSMDLADEDAERIQILASPEEEPEDHQYAPSDGWRILATINTADKASLYQMSYALSRRFGWVRIDVPEDLQGFCRQYLEEEHGFDEDQGEGPCPIADIWEAVNEIRKMGPAPFIDTIEYCLTRREEFDFFSVPSEEEERDLLVDGVNAFVAPLLDGITEGSAENLANSISDALSDDEEEGTLTELENILKEMAV